MKLDIIPTLRSKWQRRLYVNTMYTCTHKNKNTINTKHFNKINQYYRI